MKSTDFGILHLNRRRGVLRICPKMALIPLDHTTNGKMKRLILLAMLIWKLTCLFGFFGEKGFISQLMTPKTGFNGY